MDIINSSGVYSHIYDETEWFGFTDEKREYAQMKAMLAAQEARCQYTSIFIKPDPLFSDMGGTKKRVFTHTFERPVAEEFARKFNILLADFVQPGKLTNTQAKAITLKAFGP